MRKTCLDMVYKLAKEDERICFIGSDLGSGTLDAFKRDIPERFFIEGICEQNLIGVAAGLSMEGKIIYINTIASFITRRCFEQIVVDLCLHHVNVRLIGNGGGLTYAPLGPTHETIEDIAIMRALPNMTVVAPADALEMSKLMPLTVDYRGPIYIRLAKGYDPIVTEESSPFVIGKAIQMASGSDALLLTTGITLKLALEAEHELKKEGYSISIVHVPTIKPLDQETILNCINAVSVVVTIEEHSIIGGLGSAVAELIAEANFSPSKRFRRIGIPDQFPEGYGSQAELMNKYNINAANIIKVIRELSG